MTITLLGEPRSTNHIYKIIRLGKFYRIGLTKEGQAMKNSYYLQTRSQWQSEPLEGNVEAHIKLYFGTKRKADIDNYHKLSLDSLTGVVYKDDSQIQKMVVEKFYDKLQPRIEISIL